ncbi:uncharacterized protein [Diadema setosum]|uniref:uncharacterized protein n=1 Tax=Diadema setosum TaxID=31175 RepID=UPI003B3A2319
MTTEMCRNMCAHQNMRYFGLEAGKQCFCGGDFAPVKAAMATASLTSDVEFCSTPCLGNSSQICGSDLYISVYELIRPAGTDCFNPGYVPHGGLIELTGFYNAMDIVDFSSVCLPPSIRRGSPTSFCSPAGNWSDPPPTCSVRCPRPEPPSGSSFSSNETIADTYGESETLLYDCLHDSNKADQMLRCGYYGNWRASALCPEAATPTAESTFTSSPAVSTSLTSANTTDLTRASQTLSTEIPGPPTSAETTDQVKIDRQFSTQPITSVIEAALSERPTLGPNVDDFTVLAGVVLGIIAVIIVVAIVIGLVSGKKQQPQDKGVIRTGDDTGIDEAYDLAADQQEGETAPETEVDGQGPSPTSPLPLPQPIGVSRGDTVLHTYYPPGQAFDILSGIRVGDDSVGDVGGDVSHGSSVQRHVYEDPDKITASGGGQAVGRHAHSRKIHNTKIEKGVTKGSDDTDIEQARNLTADQHEGETAVETEVDGQGSSPTSSFYLPIIPQPIGESRDGTILHTYYRPGQATDILSRTHVGDESGGDVGGDVNRGSSIQRHVYEDPDKITAFGGGQALGGHADLSVQIPRTNTFHAYEEID